MITLETLRELRLLDYAVFDLSLAFVGMALASPFLSKLFFQFRLSIPKKSWVIWALPIGIITHLIFGAETLMLTRFLDPHGNYLLKSIILALVLIGLHDIRITPKKK